MVNSKTEHKTSKTLRDRVKKYQDNIKQNDPEKYNKRLEYLRTYYKQMKEACKQFKAMEKMNQNTHEIIV